jgi:hypothetical protein
MFDYLSGRIAEFLSSILPWDIDGWGDTTGRRAKSTAVPDVQGLSVEDARHVLSREGFKVEVVRLEERPAPVMGTVVRQEPPPGTRRHRDPVQIHVQHPRDRHPG